MFLSSETNVTTHPLLALSESSFLSFFHFLLSFDCDLFIMKTIFLICSFTHSIRLSRCVFGWIDSAGVQGDGDPVGPGDAETRRRAITGPQARVLRLVCPPVNASQTRPNS